MTRTDSWLVHEHALYENLLSRCRDAAEAEDWGSVDRAIRELATQLERHMTLEEEVLYPAYEASPHAPQGPTRALREEHAAIIRLIQDIARIIGSRDSDAVLESLVQLEYRMITHHEKEEDIFLPMASHILNGSREELLRRLAGFNMAKIPRRWKV